MSGESVFKEAFDRNGWTQEQIDELLKGDMLTRVRQQWFADVLDRPVDDVFTTEVIGKHVKSPTLVLNAFKNSGVKTVRDLARRNEQEMLRIAFFGTKSLAAVKAVLANHGLHLGMKDI